jgi:hypothetical protein
MLPMTTPDTMVQAAEVLFAMGTVIFAVLTGLLTGRM